MVMYISKTNPALDVSSRLWLARTCRCLLDSNDGITAVNVEVVTCRMLLLGCKMIGHLDRASRRGSPMLKSLRQVNNKML